MKRLVRVSVWVYRRLLPVYPRELRGRFGQDTAEVFEDLLCEAVEQTGAREIAALWCSALVELGSVAIPSRVKPNVVITGGLSFVVSSLITWVFLPAAG
jgi:hypothetical protein